MINGEYIDDNRDNDNEITSPWFPNRTQISRTFRRSEQFKSGCSEKVKVSQQLQDVEIPRRYLFWTIYLLTENNSPVFGGGAEIVVLAFITVGRQVVTVVFYHHYPIVVLVGQKPSSGIFRYFDIHGLKLTWIMINMTRAFMR